MLRSSSKKEEQLVTSLRKWFKAHPNKKFYLAQTDTEWVIAIKLL